MIGNDNFGDGGHTYRICSQNTEQLVFRRSFKCGALRADVHSMLNFNPFFGCNRICFANQFFVVCFTHVREARAVWDILAPQRMFGEVVDVVGDDHQVANFEVRICTAAGVGHEQGFDAQFAHHTYRERNFFHGIAFVEVEAALHRQNILVAQLAENQFAAVPLYRRYGEVGDILIFYFVLLGDLACQAAKSGSEDNCRLRMCVHLTFQISCGFLNTF